MDKTLNCIIQNFLVKTKLFMADYIVKALKHIAQVSNSNIVKYVDGLLSHREKEFPVDWTGKSKFKQSIDV